MYSGISIIPDIHNKENHFAVVETGSIMPTHIFKKARKNTRFVRHFDYNNIKETTEKQVASKLRAYPKWHRAMTKYPPSALLAKAPSHYIETNHPSSFPFSIKYPTPTGKHKRDTFKRKMIPPPLEYHDSLIFKLATDFPFELAKPQYLANTEEELKKDSTLQKQFEDFQAKMSTSEAYTKIAEIFKKRQLENCDDLYSAFDKMDIQGFRQRDVLEKEANSNNPDEQQSLEKDDSQAAAMTDEERLKVKMFLMMKKKHDQIYNNSSVDAVDDPFIDIKETKPATYKILHKERVYIAENQKYQKFK
eukprot:NODE_81_length_22753_cov_0.207072.p8 type:complete len:305 gc:universal NODE_81_length_22753_cov_0.207072:8065-8979(+)